MPTYTQIQCGCGQDLTMEFTMLNVFLNLGLVLAGKEQRTHVTCSLCKSRHALPQHFIFRRRQQAFGFLIGLLVGMAGVLMYWTVIWPMLTKGQALQNLLGVFLVIFMVGMIPGSIGLPILTGKIGSRVADAFG